GVGFDEAFRRLRQGRVYRRDVPRGVVQESYRRDAGEYFYTLDVPEGYDPARRYQVRVQLHGGVGRIETSTARSGSNGLLPRADPGEARRVAGGAVVERSPGREPARDSRRREADL